MTALSRGFASDNAAGVHPDVLAAIAAENEGHVYGYGDDPFTESAAAKVTELFGGSAEVFFVYNGTAANVLSLDAITVPHQAIICTAMAHLKSVTLAP